MVSGAMEICPVIVFVHYVLITPVLIKTFESINSVRRDHVIRQTISYWLRSVGKHDLRNRGQGHGGGRWLVHWQ